MAAIASSSVDLALKLTGSALTQRGAWVLVNRRLPAILRVLGTPPGDRRCVWAVPL
jgi:hypothetical protein